METNAITNNGSVYSTPPATPAGVSTTAKPEATPPQHDSVKLTGTALAKSLKQSGLTVAEIALKMNLDVKTVDSYLGISTNTATTISKPLSNATLHVN
jgi:DNA-binding NarL/FixJ family response regulator